MRLATAKLPGSNQLLRCGNILSGKNNHSVALLSNLTHGVDLQRRQDPFTNRTNRTNLRRRVTGPANEGRRAICSEQIGRMESLLIAQRLSTGMLILSGSPFKSRDSRINSALAANNPFPFATGKPAPEKSVRGQCGVGGNR